MGWAVRLLPEQGAVVPGQARLHLADASGGHGAQEGGERRDVLPGVPEREGGVRQQLLKRLRHVWLDDHRHALRQHGQRDPPPPPPPRRRQAKGGSSQVVQRELAAEHEALLPRVEPLDGLPHALRVLHPAHVAHRPAHVQHRPLARPACAHVRRPRCRELLLLPGPDHRVDRHNHVLARHVARQLRRGRARPRVVRVVPPLRASRVGAPPQPLLEPEVGLGGGEAQVGQNDRVLDLKGLPATGAVGGEEEDVVLAAGPVPVRVLGLQVTCRVGQKVVRVPQVAGHLHRHHRHEK
mmetsp:Transcript_33023/g.105285  ORF Transcript_33023/g.105285 Transcript_33023/m.105285 type:complete len:295 (+) Transcript_33023:366-1250(+)